MDEFREANRWIRLIRYLFKRFLSRPKQFGYNDLLQSASIGHLQELMSYYKVENLKNQTPEEFKSKLDEFMELVDAEMEGFRDAELQRGLSIQFHWGHNHDFGDFFLEGEMGNRHINLLATFIDRFDLPKSLSGMKVLDIGCWVGGISLLLSKMGAHVVAIDEVKKYTDALNYLKYAFALENLEPMNLSLYDCTREDFQDAFDYVLFAGVLYHVTDPILALRITFNCLKDGGVCFLETYATDFPLSFITKYEGPEIIEESGVKDLSRQGWNWFIPSRSTLWKMLKDVGYTPLKIGQVENMRLSASAQRENHVDMMRSGLSSRTVR